MTNSNNIFLVGLMGVGKTTIGRHLANELGMNFIDSDHEIERCAGAKIPYIFEYEGEAGFRRREEAIIAELTQQNHIILSTGGGVVLNANNRHYLKTRGYVIYLHAPVEELLVRTIYAHNRPLLNTNNPREKLETLLFERYPLYQNVADITIMTKNKSINQVVKTALKYINNIKKYAKITS